MMLLWLVKYWRFAGAGALILLLLFAYRYATNRAYNQGIASGRLQAAEEIEAAKQKEWAEREAAIAKQRDEIATMLARVSTERQAVTRDRSAAESQYRAQLGAIEARAREDNSRVLQVPISELRPSIRAVLAELRTGPDK
jgi:5'-deoxynucleotidase YfbR-like HD superfamily hydrolase